MGMKTGRKNGESVACAECGGIFRRTHWRNKACLLCRTLRRSYYKPKPRNEKRCKDCGGTFIQRRSDQKRCAACKYIESKKQSATKRRKIRAQIVAALKSRHCQQCGRLFIPESSRKHMQCEKCKVGQKKGQPLSFRVYGMLPAEYAFYSIMQQRRLTLKYVGRNGDWFPLPGGTHYRPDFRNLEGTVFYEVAGTRQAYYANKSKYLEFREAYPSLCLVVVRPDGTEIT